MICPRCASNQGDDIRFCTSCGANLQAVREALQAPESAGKFNWNNTWVAEMFMSGQANELRKREMERLLGITPEIKRYNEIKAGVIVSCVGIGVSIFLHFIMHAIAAQNPRDAELLNSIWLAGVIPFMVGLALIINGVVVSKKMVAVMEREQNKAKSLDEGAAPSPRGLKSADTNEFIPANYSVTDSTTRHLEGTERKASP
ncbi:MAG TPA: hypothetical protein VJ784_11215 [Pyrinomonadaceae bacterium]|jgi:hypothetical protein|nr:hypothetical protein [Pyrinomonadaceae bacterium]